MFNLLKKWFGIKERAPMRYSLKLKNVEVARAATKADAEVYIREIFKEVDIRPVGGRGFGTDCNTSKAARFGIFRTQWQIRKICETCGHPKGYCGQC